MRRSARSRRRATAGVEHTDGRLGRADAQAGLRDDGRPPRRGATRRSTRCGTPRSQRRSRAASPATSTEHAVIAPVPAAGQGHRGRPELPRLTPRRVARPARRPRRCSSRSSRRRSSAPAPRSNGTPTSPQAVDLEAELGVVIGRTARRVSRGRRPRPRPRLHLHQRRLRPRPPVRRQAVRALPSRSTRSARWVPALVTADEIPDPGTLADPQLPQR